MNNNILEKTLEKRTSLENQLEGINKKIENLLSQKENLEHKLKNVNNSLENLERKERKSLKVTALPEKEVV